MIAGEELRFCQVTRQKSVLVVILCRPEVDNALHAAANAELAHIFDAFVADPDLNVAIVTGTGQRAFCAGLDPHGAHEPLPATGFAGLTARFDNWKPVIAAVNGDARAEGFELALACDLIVASEQASFALDQPLRGQTAGADGIHRLVRQIPLKRAMAALLTGGSVTAPEGVLLGLVNDICGREDVLACAHSWAERILNCDARAVRATKQAALTGLQAPSLRAAMIASYAEAEPRTGGDFVAAGDASERGSVAEKA
jgi:enoyl-CoA hydratase/carnithine racemase